MINKIFKIYFILILVGILGNYSLYELSSDKKAQYLTSLFITSIVAILVIFDLDRKFKNRIILIIIFAFFLIFVVMGIYEFHYLIGVYIDIERPQIIPFLFLFWGPIFLVPAYRAILITKSIFIRKQKREDSSYEQ